MQQLPQRRRNPRKASMREVIADAIQENPNLSYLLSGIGVVSQGIQCNVPGRVKYQHSYWNAIAWDGLPLLPGTRVQIVGVDNITLIVSPLGDTFAESIQGLDR
jgi:membrane protein implicated in regulation of membrane protease activity